MNVVSGQKQTISGVSMERSPLNFINLVNPRLLYIFLFCSDSAVQFQPPVSSGDSVSEIIYETLPTGSVLLQLEDDVYMSPSDYRLLHEPVLPVTYSSCERPDGFSEEDCYYTAEQVESFTGLDLTD